MNTESPENSPEIEVAPTTTGNTGSDGSTLEINGSDPTVDQDETRISEQAGEETAQTTTVSSPPGGQEADPTVEKDVEVCSYYRNVSRVDSRLYAKKNNIHEFITRTDGLLVRFPDGSDDLELWEYTERIRSRRQRMIDEGCDEAEIKQEFNEMKKFLPSVAWSSIMRPRRGADNAIHHSGWICVDFDGLDDARINDLRVTLQSDPCVFYAFLSPSGSGLKVVVRVTGQDGWVPADESLSHQDKNKALRAFHAAAVEVAWNHFEPLGVEIDESCKDISRLCYLCYDPAPYYNPDSTPLVVPPMARKMSAAGPASGVSKPAVKSNPVRPTPPGEQSTITVPTWLDSALDHLKDSEMVHLQKVVLVYALATIHEGDDSGLEVARSFFMERTVGQQLDESQIENAYRSSRGNVTAGTIWQLAQDCGWNPPGKDCNSHIRQETYHLEELLKDRSKIDTGRVARMANRGLMEFADLPDDPASNLLGDRWLVRNAAGLLFAPSGVGKSTAITQACAAWSLGRDAFGIKPAGALRIIIFQSEDDDSDIREMMAGVREQEGYTKAGCRKISENVRVIRTRSTGLDFLKNDMVPALDFYNPDLVVINPVMSFIDGDIAQQEFTHTFFRSQLGSIMKAFNLGILLVHHTGKPPKQAVEESNRYQLQYLTFGSSDLVNMARCQLFIQSTRVEGLFCFQALKRAEKIGWRYTYEGPDGEPVIMAQRERYYSHRKTAHGTAWVEADPGDIGSLKEKMSKTRSRSNGKFPVREKSLSVEALVAAIPKGSMWTTKQIITLVDEHYTASCEMVPSTATIERAIKEAVEDGFLDRRERGKYQLRSDEKNNRNRSRLNIDV